jgi:hypothetical protein
VSGAKSFRPASVTRVALRSNSRRFVSAAGCFAPASVTRVEPRFSSRRFGSAARSASPASATGERHRTRAVRLVSGASAFSPRSDTPVLGSPSRVRFVSAASSFRPASVVILECLRATATTGCPGRFSSRVTAPPSCSTNATASASGLGVVFHTGLRVRGLGFRAAGRWNRCGPRAAPAHHQQTQQPHQPRHGRPSAPHRFPIPAQHDRSAAGCKRAVASPVPNFIPAPVRRLRAIRCCRCGAGGGGEAGPVSSCPRARMVGTARRRGSGRSLSARHRSARVRTGETDRNRNLIRTDWRPRHRHDAVVQLVGLGARSIPPDPTVRVLRVVDDPLAPGRVPDRVGSDHFGHVLRAPGLVRTDRPANRIRYSFPSSLDDSVDNPFPSGWGADSLARVEPAAPIPGAERRTG